jgi:hypothetical protein
MIELPEYGTSEAKKKVLYWQGTTIALTHLHFSLTAVPWQLEVKIGP